MGKDLEGKELGRGISQIKTGSYMARYTDRFGNRKYIYDKSLRELKKKYNKAKAENELGLNIVTSKVTLDEWFVKWIELYKSNMRSNTLLLYNYTYNKYISPYLGKCELAKIKNMHIQRLLMPLEKKNKNFSSLGVTVTILKELFRTAAINNLITENPAVECRIPPIPRKEKYVPSKEELELFFKWSKDHFLNNAFIVQVSTGIRPGELLGLMVQDIDFANKSISIKRTLHYRRTFDDKKFRFFFGDPKTATSVRTVPMSSSCELAIKNQMELRKKILLSHTVTEEFKDLLFFSKRGTPLSNWTYGNGIKQVINKINSDLNLEPNLPYFTPHAFRHFFGTQCYEAQVDLKVIQKILGHSSLATTSDIYVHTTENSEKNAIDKIELMQKLIV